MKLWHAFGLGLALGGLFGVIAMALIAAIWGDE